MSMSSSYAINGRFMGQTSTGVQRYALNVVQAMDDASEGLSSNTTVIAPPNAMDVNFNHLKFVKIGRLTGHAWEQLSLPAYWQGRLLNLCNTAPARKSDQIVCIHDANIFTAPDSYSYRFRALYQMLQPLLSRRSARIATVSHAAARQLARHLPLSVNDIVVLTNGHEHALEWDPTNAKSAPAFVENYYADTGRQFILAIGSRARHKNISLLIEAAPALDEIGVDIVIAGGNATIFAPGLGISRPNVKFVGRVSDDDLAYLLQSALCLAFPSLTEGFGLPIVEAMARNCPVIASDCASMPEVCGAAALLASPFDSSAWVRHVQALKGSPELRLDLAGRGREQIKNFSWKKTAAGYVDLLQQPFFPQKQYRPAKIEPLRTTVVIATRGRPDIANATVRYLLSTQTLRPEAVIVSCIDQSDAGELVNNPAVTVLTGPPGLAAQRNTALANLPATTEIVVFFDDDFIAERDWLSVAAATFRDDSQIVGFTGRVLADGVNGPGISFEEGVAMVEMAQPSDWKWIEPYSPYGCNMAFRLSAIGSIRFDERLVLYGWLEDRDFSSALAKRGGRFVKCADAIGLHMGVKSGRVSGERFGYSQIVNPIYMLRKGTMSLTLVANHIGANVASNFGRALKPEPFVDRRGRARGNIKGIIDVLCGRLRPERAETLGSVKASIKPSMEMKRR